MEYVGAYRLVQELARGGMGVVYLAEAPSGEQVAIKRLLGDALGDPDAIERFRREANALRALNHPGILGVRDCGLHGAQPYMVMDLLSGPTLAEVVRREGALPAEQISALGQRTAEALAYAHGQGVVHRDLKPENVILRGPGDPVLVDFGLVRMLNLEASRLTATGMVLGTPAYMAPEQAQEASRVDFAADVYGLGATLYHLATGRPPFDGPTLVGVLQQVISDAPQPPRELRPELPLELEAAILRCLEKDPLARFGSAIELADALGWARPRPARSRALWVVGLVLLLLLGAVGVVVAMGPRGDADFARGRELVFEGRYEEALPALNRVLERDPDRGPAWLARGIALLKLNRLEEAEADFTRALEKGADRHAALLNRGIARANLEHFADALPDFDEALRLEESAWGFLYRAYARIELDDSSGALADLVESERLQPDQPATELLGETLVRAGKAVDGVEVLQVHLRNHPDDFEGRLWLGEGYLTLRRFDEALAEFERVLAAVDDHWRALLGCAIATFELKRYQESLAHCDRLNASSESALVLRLRSRNHIHTGNYTEASRDIARSLELDPNNPEIFAARAEFKARQRDFRGALDDCERALRGDPQLVMALVLKGDALANLRQFEPALAAYEAVLRIDQRVPSAFLGRADVRRVQGDHAGAVEDYGRALELVPDNAHCLAKRALSLRVLGQRVAALADLERVRQLNPQDWRAQLQRVYVLGELDRFDESRAAYEEARKLDLDPESRAELEHYRRTWLR